jgi:DNA polymerase III subunit delta'
VPLPAAAEALPWLQAQGVPDAAVLLAAAAGRPLDALALQRAGIGAAAWKALPDALSRGQAAMQGWPLPQALDTLLKLAHDAMAVAAGAAPRYFPAGSLPPSLAPASLPALQAWSGELQRVARHASHPWNEGVLIDALVAQAARALAAPRRPRSGGAGGAPGAGFATLPV